MKNEYNEEQTTLITSHIKFAKKQAAEFYHKRRGQGFELDDFEGAALLGLCDAARRFDASKGNYFKTFAYFRIKGAMYDLLRYGSGIQRRHFNRLVENQQSENSQNPPANGTQHKKGEADYAHALSSENLPYAFARSAHELAGLVNILDQVDIKIHVIGEGQIELSYSDLPNPEDAAIVKNSKQYLASLIEQLPEKDREIIRLRYFDNLTFEEIGETMGGLSKSWVSRLHATALGRLRELLGDEGMSAFGG